MKPSNAFGSGFAAAILFLSGSAPAVDIAPVAAQQAGSALNHSVIVVMRNHHLTGAEAESDRAPVLNALAQTTARPVKRFQAVNSFATTVSADELERLHVDRDHALPAARVRRTAAARHRQVDR